MARTTPGLHGRVAERGALDQTLERVRGGQSAALVFRGEAGIGKTSLLQYCAGCATDCRVVQISGIESEMDLPLAALHQLCGAMLGTAKSLPEPQELALRIAFGQAQGPAPERFILGLAVLSLLSDAAALQPLVCLVDDAQWLDVASRQVLGFAARRLLAESVLLVFAVREEGDNRLFPNLPEMLLEGLSEDDARALLLDAVPGSQLDDGVRERIVAETRGNPLGLLELSKGLSRVELAGGFTGPIAGSVSDQVETHYLRQVQELPESSRRLILLAALDPTGDATLLWRAAEAIGVGRAAAIEAEARQLLAIGSRVSFRHPLLRSAVQSGATPEARRAAHLALAAATDPDGDPERRVWHQAAAATGTDEFIASDLERSAGAVRARGGIAAAAAFLERSVALTAEPSRRAERALAAAIAHVQAGAFATALALLADAEAAAVDDRQRARAEHLRGQIAWASNPEVGASGRLLEAAARLESLDVRLARQSYFDAWFAAFTGSSLTGPGGLLEISRAAAAVAPPPGAPEPCDLLLDGMAAVITDGLTPARPRLRHAVDAFLAEKVRPDTWARGGAVAPAAAIALWDAECWSELSTRHVEVARTAGALMPLCIALNSHAFSTARRGDLDAAEALVAEERALKEVIGIRLPSTGGVTFAGYRGRTADGSTLSRALERTRAAGGAGLWAQLVGWATAVLHNGRSDHPAALAIAQQAAGMEVAPFYTPWIWAELVEAAMRCNRADVAVNALDRLATTTLPDSDWAAGVEARCRALTSEGRAAEECYVEAVERLARTPLRPELGRAHLVYGEWLRRERRTVDARAQLHVAFEMFVAMGAEAFAERARRELLATGEKVRKRDPDATHDLTPQEAHIVRLARGGRTNSEIGAELFISARTVEWHLRKVFAKLGISSRRELAQVLPVRGAHPGPNVDTRE